MAGIILNQPKELMVFALLITCNKFNFRLLYQRNKAGWKISTGLAGFYAMRYILVKKSKFDFCTELFIARIVFVFKIKYI